MEPAGDAVQLQIDLDCDQAVTLTIGRDGHATTRVNDYLVETVPGRGQAAWA